MTQVACLWILAWVAYRVAALPVNLDSKAAILWPMVCVCGMFAARYLLALTNFDKKAKETGLRPDHYGIVRRYGIVVAGLSAAATMVMVNIAIGAR